MLRLLPFRKGPDPFPITIETAASKNEQSPHYMVALYWEYPSLEALGVVMMQDNHYVGFHVMSAVEMVLRGSWDSVST